MNAPPPFRPSDAELKNKETFGSAQRELDELRPAAPENQKFWIKAAIVVTWVTIFISLFYAIVALVFAIRVNSTSMLAYSLETIVDSLSSFFVIWRFWGFWGKEALPPHDRRDMQASVLISFFFVILSLIILAAAIEQLATRDRPETGPTIIVLAAIGLILGILFAIAKFVSAHYTSSSVLHKDAWASAAGAVLSLGTLISYWAYLKAPGKPWWIDGSVALVIGFLLLIYGIWGLAEEPWWEGRFWRSAPPPATSVRNVDRLSSLEPDHDLDDPVI